MTSPILTGIAGLLTIPDVAIDMGTANTRLFAGARLAVDVPTRVTLRDEKAEGRSVRRRTSSAAKTIEPLQRGVVEDIPAASYLLKGLFRRITATGFHRPRVMVCAPGDICDDGRASLIEAVMRTGARSVVVGDAALAGAIGAGLDIASPYAQMLVDIGHGVTEIAVIREGHVLQRTTIDAGGIDMHQAAGTAIADQFGTRISPDEAERLIISLGAAGRERTLLSRKIEALQNGGGEMDVNVNSRSVFEALQPIIGQILEAIYRSVKELPPKECAEVVETGICLTGGVAQLSGLADLISERTHMPAWVAPFPLYSVVRGASRMMETLTETNSWRHFERRLSDRRAAEPSALVPHFSIGNSDRTRLV